MNFTDDKILGYGNSYQVFSAGDELVLDKNYRRAHLPLVNSSHPDVIANDEDNCMGTYNTHRRSIVLPINDERLRQTMPMSGTNG